jgi:hypothetical protein
MSCGAIRFKLRRYSAYLRRYLVLLERVRSLNRGE